MACWPANIVGAFFVSVLIIDCILGTYGNLLTHSVIGIIVTLVFFMICMFLGEDLSAALLVVPSILAVTFGLSLWFIGQSLKNRGYCMKQGSSDKCAPTESSSQMPSSNQVASSNEVGGSKTLADDKRSLKEKEDKDTSDETYYFFFPWLKPEYNTLEPVDKCT